ncbi:HNH endonuclease [Staphylococcus epidermidis]|uniref:HNH endonuclease n=1 Tax=Bacilli TaxID=91061 RepID=UPI00026BF047|nr:MULTISPECIES: HNH endonuclease [Bacilli]MDS6035238.1 HNH endonuclease [Streptococcus pneumoniae]MDU4769978.1 HNH endonuclease [Staphylococcus lugdunensis]SLC55587.1 HNH endonuclease [Mycobacteroides abscessus subsp. massiliense]ARG67034.1 HNH endonuclease [Staphylococcus epidermidis]EJE18401.1 prophage L54a, HNH endonuclease family protein [Staphylococcus epidermidis NIHLM015]
MFKEPKVRLGNRTYSQSELQDYRKANTQRYNNKVRYSSQNSKYTDFYHSSQWRKLRKQVLLRDNYLCQHCLNKGIVNDKDLIVHHKVELKEEWGKRLDMDNLEAVCIGCHNKIHKN